MSSYYGFQYGTQRYGGAVPPVFVEAVLPPRVGSDGGYEVTLSGRFPTGQAIRVYVGPAGDNTDQPAYSGVSGQGLDIYSLDGETITFVTPALDKGNQFVTVAAAAGDDVGALAAVERAWASKTYRMRKNLPPWYATGSRRAQLEERQ